MRTNRFFTFFSLCLFSLTAASPALKAEPDSAPTPRPYPTSPQIESALFEPEKRAILAELFAPDIKPKTLLKDRPKLCAPSLSRLAPINDSAKRAVTTTQASLAAEVFFERSEPTDSLELERYSIFVEFSSSRALLRHSTPRFPSDVSGFSVPFASSQARPLRLEGKFGSDIYAVVPPLRECNVRAVALCPRYYTKNEELLRAPYAVRSIRPLIEAKADGVYGPPQGITGKVMASILASADITLPTTWFKISTGTGSLSQSFELDSSSHVKQKHISIQNLPISLALESRVDIGNTQGSIRTASKRAQIEVSTITLLDQKDVQLGTSELSVQGGECYLITQWTDEVV